MTQWVHALVAPAFGTATPVAYARRCCSSFASGNSTASSASTRGAPSGVHLYDVGPAGQLSPRSAEAECGHHMGPLVAGVDVPPAPMASDAYRDAFAACTPLWWEISGGKRVVSAALLLPAVGSGKGKTRGPSSAGGGGGNAKTSKTRDTTAMVPCDSLP